jgi:hypothetical protein
MLARHSMANAKSKNIQIPFIFILAIRSKNHLFPSFRGGVWFLSVQFASLM